MENPIMKRTVKFGIFGLGRGGSFYNTVLLNNGEIVAVCDLNEKKLADAKKHLGENLATYTDFDEFINHEGLEAIFLCNYFHEHAEYAIKALKKIIDRHMILKEFTIQAISKGSDDMGKVHMQVEYDGHIYYGFGANTDIIAASVEAYIDCINKFKL